MIAAACEIGYSNNAVMKLDLRFIHNLAEKV